MERLIIIGIFVLLEESLDKLMNNKLPVLFRRKFVDVILNKKKQKGNPTTLIK